MNAKMKFYLWVDSLFFLSLLIVTITGVVIWGWLRPAGAGGKDPNPDRKPAIQAVEQAPQGERAAAPQEKTAEIEKGRGDKSGAERGAQPGAGGGEGQAQAKLFWGLMRGNTLLGGGKGVWKNVHCWTSLLMILCFIVHTYCHRRWFAAAFKESKKKESREAPQPEAKA